MDDEPLSVDASLERPHHNGPALQDLIDHPDPERGTVHTPREIAQQPELWRHTARLMQEHASPLQSFLDAAGLYDEHPPEVILTGAGTSHYVGLSVVDLLGRQFSASCVARPTTRLTPNPERLGTSDRPFLMIHYARSGNSPESRAVLEAALKGAGEQGVHLVITCNEDGTLAEMARAHSDRVYLVVLHEASNDQGLAMTSSFSSMVVASQALAHLDEMDAFREQVDRTAEAGTYVLRTYPDRMYDLVGEKVTRAFFLGNNDLYGVATESALKIQELTAGQVLAFGEDTLAFRHGPISAVNGSSLVCVYLSEQAYTRRYELDVVRQYQDAFQEMGVQTVVVSPQRPERLGEAITVMPYDPEQTWNVPALQQATVAVLFGQLAGLFAAYRRNVNVDEPSTEKALYNRTVRGVQLYDPSEAF